MARSCLHLSVEKPVCRCRSGIRYGPLRHQGDPHTGARTRNRQGASRKKWCGGPAEATIPTLIAQGRIDMGVDCAIPSTLAVGHARGHQSRLFHGFHARRAGIWQETIPVQCHWSLQRRGNGHWSALHNTAWADDSVIKVDFFWCRETLVIRSGKLTNNFGGTTRVWDRERGIQLAYRQPETPPQNAQVGDFDKRRDCVWLSKYHWSTIEKVWDTAAEGLTSFRHDGTNVALDGSTP